MSDFPSSPETKASAVSRVDLHLHTRYSMESDLWLLRQAGVGESNTDPETAYRTAREKGMTHVTLTDHNTIEGALRLEGREGFFISEEVTAYFPGEDVKLHLLALDINEGQHHDISRLRPNLYELVSYLNVEGITYVLAHPLTRLGGELTPGHIERLMLLFPIWEILNGSTLQCENWLARELAAQCNREKLLYLADRHDLAPVTCDRIAFAAGSDDHAGFDIASVCTVTAAAGGVAGFLTELKAGRSSVEGAHGSTQKLAHTMLSLLAQGAEEDRRGGNGWRRLLSLATGRKGSAGLLKSLVSDRDFRHAFIPFMGGALKARGPGNTEFHGELFSKVGMAWAAGMRSTLSGLSQITRYSLFENLDKVGRLIALQLLLLPYSLSANYHSRQRHFLKRLRGEMLADGKFSADGGNARSRIPRIGLFTDTLGEINGVTAVLTRLEEFCRTKDRPLEVIACGNGGSPGGRMVRFPAVTSVRLPEYGELELSVPPVLDVIMHCEKQQFDIIHAATPGPLGLTALLASRILQVPLVSSFHTDVPRCVGRLTDDKLNEEVAWTYTRWFYQHSDLIFVPSAHTGKDLAVNGLDHSRMAVLYQGVDSNGFSPRRRSRKWRQALGGDEKKILMFAGRLSAEKGLRFLADCYLELASRRNDLHLAIVGDGPMRAELEDVLRGWATFTGWLKGRDLASAYASADLFVFPSSVDTSGQAVLEAQASGLPVVLTSGGGARENIVPGGSGLAATPGDGDDFNHCLEALLDDEERRRSMASRARQVAGARSWEKAFGDLFDTYAELVDWWSPVTSGRQGECFTAFNNGYLRQEAPARA